MAKTTRTCVVCRSEYRYCPHCVEYKDLPDWMITFDKEECMNIFNTTMDVVCNRKTKEEAKQIFDQMDLSYIDFEKLSPGLKKDLTEIMGAQAAPIVEETPVVEEVPVVEETPVEEEIPTEETPTEEVQSENASRKFRRRNRK